jgi:hypothetical protein
MSDTRKRALAYLGKVIGEVSGEMVSASKFFEPEESWRQKEAWWFTLPIKKIKANKENYYYLLGAHKKTKYGFVIVKVPNRFLLGHLKRFDTRYNETVILHLAAYKDNWLVDERLVENDVNFSRFEIK